MKLSISQTGITARMSALALITLTLGLVPAQAAPPAPKAPPAAAASLSVPGSENALGPENAQQAQRVGAWNVVETVWASPGAAPVVTQEIAERRMIGAFLQETIRAAPGSAASGIKRIDYLSFHRLEGRWKYVSMDMRAPVGIMSAESFGRGAAGQIEVMFQPFAIPGKNKVGELLQMRQLIIQQDANHDRKDQYFIPADGSGQPWLGHRYAYSRRL